ncbi:MAG: hypothetical protein IJC31_01440, partial [Spirochaetaceae bacterium]|nr:hypothetical protein [Spirochaetaceae bacterium]
DGELGLFYDYVRERTARTPFTRELDKTISRMKQEQEERNMYLTYTSRMMECRRDGYEEGISIGLERGLEQGAYQTKLETARSMLEDGFPVSTASKYTNLPLEVVEQLAGDSQSPHKKTPAEL